MPDFPDPSKYHVRITSHGVVKLCQVRGNVTYEYEYATLERALIKAGFLNATDHSTIARFTQTRLDRR